MLTAQQIATWAETRPDPAAAVELRPFQRRFVRAVAGGKFDICALSIPRGNGKSWLAGHLVTRALTPGDPLFVAGSESVLLAASLEQARIVQKFVRRWLDGNPDYRWQDSKNAVGITHVPTNTKVRALGSNGKTALGLGADTNLAIADEPGAWENAGGQLLADALDTALAKPGSRMRVIYIGTIAPAVRGWWPELIDSGTVGRTYVQALQGDTAKWDRWPEIRRCNPLTMISRQFARKLIEERNAAQRSDRLRARFCSYRLNAPESDPATVLLTVEDWRRVIARPVPDGVGLPLVGVDAGANLSWSAATFAWANGRVEAIAVIPGLPGVAAQEKRDAVPAGTYQRLVDSGQLVVAEGRRRPDISIVIDAVFSRSTPYRITCDSFRAPEVLDAVRNRVRVEVRPINWATQTADISATRIAAADGDLSVDPPSRKLLELALSESKIKSDDSGSVRLIKARGAGRSRDDSTAALLLAVGAAARERAKLPKAS